MNGFQFHVHLSAIIWTVNLRLDQTNSLTHAVLSFVHAVDGHLLCCSSSTRFMPSENILCQWKSCALDIASSPKACWSFPCVVVALSLSLTQKKGISLHDVPCFHFHNRVHKYVLTRQAPTPHWGIAKPCYYKWGWRKDQGQSLC